MGDPKRPQSRMRHDATLGGMLSAGAHVVSLCKICQRAIPVDIKRGCRIIGQGATLWDRFLPCLYADCPDGLTAFHCSTGPATPLRPLQSYDVFRTNDGMGWLIWPRWPGQPPYGYGIGEHIGGGVQKSGERPPW